MVGASIAYQRLFPDWQFQETYATPCTPTPHRQDRGSRSAVAVSDRTSWPRSSSPNCWRVHARRWRARCVSARPPLRLRGPVTGPTAESGIGRGYGARVDMEKLSTTDPHRQLLLPPHIIWTWPGRHQPYKQRRRRPRWKTGLPRGWTTDAATDPGWPMVPLRGCTPCRNGSLVAMVAQRVTPCPGPFDGCRSRRAPPPYHAAGVRPRW